MGVAFRISPPSNAVLATGRGFCAGQHIKIAVLAELYHQAQQGKLKLTDLYTFRSPTLQDSDIMTALTPASQHHSPRPRPTMTVAVSDNSAGQHPDRPRWHGHVNAL